MLHGPACATFAHVHLNCLKKQNREFLPLAKSYGYKSWSIKVFSGAAMFVLSDISAETSLP